MFSFFWNGPSKKLFFDSDKKILKSFFFSVNSLKNSTYLFCLIAFQSAQNIREFHEHFFKENMAAILE